MAIVIYNKTCLKRPLKKKGETKVLMVNGSLMKAISGLENFFEWPLKTGFTVNYTLCL